jgi:glutaredoxin 3
MQSKWQILLALALFAVGLGGGYAAMQIRDNAQNPEHPWSVDLAAAGLMPTTEPLVFTISTCPACRSSRVWLAEQGIVHRELVMDESEDARRLADALGIRAVPAYVVGDRAMVGFHPERLEAFLAEVPGARD